MLYPRLLQLLNPSIDLDQLESALIEIWNVMNQEDITRALTLAVAIILTTVVEITVSECIIVFSSIDGHFLFFLLKNFFFSIRR